MSNIYKLFEIAVYMGESEAVESLLQHPDINPAVDDNAAIRMVSERGHARVMQLLLADSRTDPATNNNEAIRTAAHVGTCTPATPR
jgi:hypothetical protein